MIYVVTPSTSIDNIVTGNYQTAFRYVKFLEEFGIRSNLIFDHQFNDWVHRPSGVILLNAKKSHKIAMECKKRLIPYALVLTGTDIYADITKNNSSCYEKCIDSILGAQVIIVLQPHAKKKLIDIVPDIKTKIYVIFQSTTIKTKNYFYKKSENQIFILMVGNIRKEKDLVTGINGFLDTYDNSFIMTKYEITLTHIGAELECEYAKLVKNLVSKSRSINFLGYKNNSDVINEMMKSDLLLNTSVTEGGSLVIKEAIDLNLPILASNIPCHKEMLGHGYPGFFESEDHKDLSRKLQSFIVEKKIRESWKTSLSNSPITNYGRSEESKLLADVIGSLQ